MSRNWNCWRTSSSLWQADEKVARHRVAAGSPRHISYDFKTRRRRKAAATPVFISLLDKAAAKTF
jgi:hypothetical protein